MLVGKHRYQIAASMSIVYSEIQTDELVLVQYSHYLRLFDIVFY